MPPPSGRDRPPGGPAHGVRMESPLVLRPFQGRFVRGTAAESGPCQDIHGFAKAGGLLRGRRPLGGRQMAVLPRTAFDGGLNATYQPNSAAMV